MAKPKLTAKQELFCQEYLVDLNATQAAIRAGYSKSTAQSIGAENLTKPLVQASISKSNKKRLELTAVDANYVLSRLKEIDRLDILDIIEDDLSGFRLLSEWPKVWRTSINSLDMKRIVTNIGDDDSMETLVEKIKWPDKVKNLELIGRHTNVKAWDSDFDDGTNNVADAVNNLIDKLPN